MFAHDWAPRGRSGKEGFTLVEVIVATIVLAAGLLGLAGATAQIVRQATLADLITERAYAVQSVVERVQATPFASVASGSDSLGNFSMQWGAASESVASKVVTVVTSGPGLANTGVGTFSSLGPNVVDTFTFRVINR